MEKLLQELKEELLNKELTLLELDNTAQRITESTTSMFDNSLTRDILNEDQNGKIIGSCAYWIVTKEENKEIAIDFEIIDKAVEKKIENEEDLENELEIVVKVADIHVL